MSRRTLIKTVGLTAGAGAVGVSDINLIGDADAVVPLIAGMVAASTTFYVASELDLIGSDAPPEGLTADALKQQLYQTALTRQSTNASTFTDNRNIINYMPEVAFSEGKKAALEALNDGKSQSEVEGAAKSAAAAHYVTVEKNLLKSWNESVAEVELMQSTAVSHGSVTSENVIQFVGADSNSSDTDDAGSTLNFPTRDISLRDGSSFTLNQLEVSGSFDLDGTGYNSETATYDVDTFSLTYSPNPMDDYFIRVNTSENVPYLRHTAWNAVWSDLQSQFDQIDSNIVTWVDNTYDSVQQGEIDSADLISGVDLANMSDVPQAVADLVAANIPVDLDNQLTLTMGNETMAGYLATTDQNALSEVAPGDTIDPNATDADGNDLYGDIFIAHDLAEWRYDWTAYDSDKGVDGGVVWYTADPAVIDGIRSEATLFHTIETTDGERATVTPSDFTETTDGSGNTVWEADLSDKLETTITSIASVTVALDTTSKYSIRKLDEPFTVDSTESGDAVTMTQDRDPQTDTNYITQEEWDQLKSDYDELIDKFEDSQSSSSLFGGLFDDGSIPTLPGLNLVESAVVVFLGLAGFNIVTSS